MPRSKSITYPLPGMRKSTLLKQAVSWSPSTMPSEQGNSNWTRRKPGLKGETQEGGWNPGCGTSPCALCYLGSWCHLLVNARKTESNPTGGPRRGPTIITRRTTVFTYFRSPISTKYSLFIITLPYSAAAASPSSHPSLSSQWLLPLGFLCANQQVDY